MKIEKGTNLFSPRFGNTYRITKKKKKNPIILGDENPNYKLVGTVQNTLHVV